MYREASTPVPAHSRPRVWLKLSPEDRDDLIAFLKTLKRREHAPIGVAVRVRKFLKKV